MIGTIRKHSKWLWAVIITITIITFVFWNSSSNSGANNSKLSYWPVDGEPVSKDAYASAAREAWLEFYLQNANNPRAQFDEQRLTYIRLFWIKKLKDYNIQISQETAVKAAQELLRTNNNMTVQDFEQRITPNATFADFERFLRHTLGVQELRMIVGLSSELVTPPEVESLYLRDNQELLTDAAFFSATNYAGLVVTPGPEALTQFFDANRSKYRLHERVQVSYVKFDPTNFLADADRRLAEITNLTARIDKLYEERKTNFAHVKSPEEAKKQILEEGRLDLAMEAAHKKAGFFAEALYDLKPLRPGNLAALAATNGFTVKTTAPFEEQSGPANLDTGLNFARAAFALSSDDPFTEQPVFDNNAFYVMALDKRIPSENPPLAQVRDRVQADYKQDQALQLARRAGAQFAQALTNGLAQGKTFAAVCAEAKVKPISVPPCSLSTESLPEVEDYVSLFVYKRIIFSMPVGKSSNLMDTEDGGVVVYTKQLLPIDKTKMKAELPGFTRMVRTQRWQDTVNSWYQREALKSLRDTPLVQPGGAPGPRRS